MHSLETIQTINRDLLNQPLVPVPDGSERRIRDLPRTARFFIADSRLWVRHSGTGQILSCEDMDLGWSFPDPDAVVQPVLLIREATA